MFQSAFEAPCRFRVLSLWQTLPRAEFCRTLSLMEVHFTPEQEAKLAQSAAQQGRNPDELVRQVVARYFDEESRFVDAVRRGEEEALRKFLEITSVLHGKSGFWSPTA